MIRITAELIPGGLGPARTIGSIEIANLSQLADLSDYAYRMTTVASPLTGRPTEIQNGFIRDHIRKQPIWALVEKIIAKHKDWL